MPADYEKCVEEGGRVRTKKLKGGKYLHICFDKAGKSHAGEVKMGEKKGKSTKEAYKRAASKKMMPEKEMMMK